MLAIRNKLKRLLHSYPFPWFPGTLWSLQRHYVCHFPVIAFTTFLPFRLSFSRHCVHYFFPTLRLSFSHHCILIFPPFRLSFSAIVFVFFPPFFLSFSRHCIRHFPAITFVIFPPRRSVLSFSFFRHCVRQSSLSRCSRHYICHRVRHLPACTLIILSLGRHYVCHFLAVTFFTSRLKVCPEF